VTSKQAAPDKCDKDDDNTGIVNSTARAHDAVDALEEALSDLRTQLRPVLLEPDDSGDGADKAKSASSESPAVEEISRLIRRVRWQTDCVRELISASQI